LLQNCGYDIITNFYLAVVFRFCNCVILVMNSFLNDAWPFLEGNNIQHQIIHTLNGLLCFYKAWVGLWPYIMNWIYVAEILTENEYGDLQLFFFTFVRINSTLIHLDTNGLLLTSSTGWRYFLSTLSASLQYLNICFV